MSWFGTLWTRMRALRRGERIYGEINEEMQFHIEMRTQENIRRGLRPDEAREAAARSFGQVTRIAEMGFEVMGLRPQLGRLLNSADDGRKAASAVVLTHRFWTSVYNSDPNVVGKPIRLRVPSAPESLVSTIVGVLALPVLQVLLLFLICTSS